MIEVHNGDENDDEENNSDDGVFRPVLLVLLLVLLPKPSVLRANLRFLLRQLPHLFARLVPLLASLVVSLLVLLLLARRTTCVVVYLMLTSLKLRLSAIAMLLSILAKARSLEYGPNGNHQTLMQGWQGAITEIRTIAELPDWIPYSDKEVVSDSSRTATEEDIKLYQQMMGLLSWLPIRTRPDIAHAVSKLTRFAGNPSPEDLVAVMHVLRNLRGTRTLSLSRASDFDEQSPSKKKVQRNRINGDILVWPFEPETFEHLASLRVATHLICPLRQEVL